MDVATQSELDQSVENVVENRVYRKSLLGTPIVLADSPSAGTIDLNSVTPVPSWATHVIIKGHTFYRNGSGENSGQSEGIEISVNGLHLVGTVFTPTSSDAGDNDDMDVSDTSTGSFSLNGSAINYEILYGSYMEGVGDRSRALGDLILIGFERIVD